MRFIVTVLILLIPIVLANPLQLAHHLHHRYRHRHPFAHSTDICTDLPAAEAEEEGARTTELGTDAPDHEGAGTEDGTEESAAFPTEDGPQDDPQDDTQVGTVDETEDGTHHVGTQAVTAEATPAEDTVDENADAVSTSSFRVWYSGILKNRKASSSSSSLVEVLIEQPQVLM